MSEGLRRLSEGCSGRELGVAIDIHYVHNYK